jgi:hypothetical protein
MGKHRNRREVNALNAKALGPMPEPRPVDPEDTVCRDCRHYGGDSDDKILCKSRRMAASIDALTSNTLRITEYRQSGDIEILAPETVGYICEFHELSPSAVAVAALPCHPDKETEVGIDED